MVKKNNPNLKETIVHYFNLAWNGQEEIKNIFWWWGVFAYFICYFVVDNLLKISPFRIIDIFLCLLISSYFTLHIILIKKNTPKKPELTKEEKAAIKEELRKTRLKRFTRKLLLKEPLTKWRPGLVFGAVDLFIITHYLQYIL